MLAIYLYHGDLYSDLRISDLYFRPAGFVLSHLLMTEVVHSFMWVTWQCPGS